MAAHQPGCCCDGCCECDGTTPSSNDWIADIGAGGLVDDCCSNCDQFQGEYPSITTANCTPINDPVLSVSFNTFANTLCPEITCTDDCDAGSQTWVQFVLRIDNNVDGNNKCDYVVHINITIAEPCGDGAFDGAGSMAFRYEKLGVAKTNCTGTEWIVLTKVYEHNNAFNGSPANQFYCSGTLPTTIRVRRDL